MLLGQADFVNIFRKWLLRSVERGSTAWQVCLALQNPPASIVNTLCRAPVAFPTRIKCAYQD